MIKKLKIKFMIVTMSLMLVTFTVFFTVNYINSSYWYTVDAYHILEWLADSGIFINKEPVTNEDFVPEVYDEEENPIIGVITNETGCIISQKNIGKGKKQTVSQDVVNKILAQKKDKQSFKSFVYVIRELDDDNKLIVVQDTAIKSKEKLRLVGTGILILLGVVALAIITLFLSKFITEPARKALEREKQFVSDASHELKTPIGAININVQAINSDSEDIHLKNILSETQRMNYLIEKLLTLSKLEGTSLINRSSCSLTDIVNEIVLTYESVSFEKGITYQYDIKDNIDVLGYEDELKQLVTILIDNAIKYTDTPGLISINLFKKGSHAILEVMNTGKGIAKEDLSYIFERFYTNRNSKRADSYGLGLSIAQSIVKRHKGTISVSSVINEETVFTVTI